jgi:hypothetical protein
LALRMKIAIAGIAADDAMEGSRTDRKNALPRIFWLMTSAMDRPRAISRGTTTTAYLTVFVTAVRKVGSSKRSR